MDQGWLYKLQVIREKNLDRDLRSVNADPRKMMYVTIVKKLVIGTFNFNYLKIILSLMKIVIWII
jgi:hypothetical protein